MRKQILKTLVAINFLLAIAIVPAKGQTLAYQLKANIPFDFIVADQTLPAGEYSITRTRQYSGDDLLTISSADGHTLAVLFTSSVQSLTPKRHGVMIFHRYGNEHFLSEVWPAGAITGRSLFKSRSERDLKREAEKFVRTGNEKMPATVTVNVVNVPL